MVHYSKARLSVACRAGARSRLTSKYLLRVDGIECIALVAKLARNIDGVALFDDRLHFVVAQHPQHGDDALGRARAAKRDRTRLEETQVVFVVKAMQKDFGR